MTRVAEDSDAEVWRWSRQAAGYAKWWDLFERAAQPVSDRLVDLAGLAPGQAVLDIATGVGEPAITAARRVGPGGRVLATDCAPAMLRQAVRRARALGLTNIDFRRMDGERPDVAPAFFDAVLCRWGLMFLPDLDAALRRFRAALRPQGRFAAAVWSAPDDVPFIHLSAAVLAERAPLAELPVGPLHPFRLSEPGLLERAMRTAGFVDVAREASTVIFDFASAEDYTRFRRDLTSLDAALAEAYPPPVVDAAWHAVTEAARRRAGDDGRVRLANTAVCVSAGR